MPTADLFLITRTLQRLLDLNVRSLLFRQGLAPNVDVTTMPPEQVGAVPDTLNLHLYHLLEDPYYKNTPPAGNGGPPISRQPLTFSLFYILTAHHEVNNVFDAETQQRLMGLAMKSFHDHPIIDDDLQISPDGGAPQTVMAAGLEGRDNRIELILRPLSPEESMGFWAAEQVSTTRFSAYYEARTIFFEPEEPTGASGRVYDLGLFVSAGRAPVLDRVAALTSFSPPPQTGLGTQTIETAPARATLAPGLMPEVNRVRLAGSGLTGDGRPAASRIVLRTPAWRELVPPVASATIDPALNPGWNVELREADAHFDLQGQLDIDDGGAVVGVEVTPGIYAVSIETTRRRETSTGQARLTTSVSNQIAFSVGAGIDGFDPPNPQGRLVLRVVNVFDMLAPALEVQLSIDGLLYEETNAFADDPLQDQGLFLRQAGQLEFHPLFDPAQTGSHPVRLLINGAESPPLWINTP